MFPRTSNAKSDFAIRHNSESFKKMWHEVGEATGTKWRVETEMIDAGERYMKERVDAHGLKMRRIVFSVFRE